MTRSLLFLLFMVVVSVIYSAPITKNNVLTYLKTYGYIQCKDKSCSNIVLADALRDFQKRSALPVTGVLDDATKQLMDMPGCGVKEKPLSADGSLPLALGVKWRKKHITWKFLGPAPSQIGSTKTIKILSEAFQRWSDIVPLEFSRVCDQCKADIPIDFTSIDGKSGKLAFVQYNTVLPYLDDGTTVMRFDKAENWVEAFPRSSNDQTNLFLVAVHEIGHAIGLDHDEMDRGAIMFPKYGAKIFQKSDMVPYTDKYEIQKVYGSKKGGTKQATTTIRTTLPPDDSPEEYVPPPTRKPEPPHIPKPDGNGCVEKTERFPGGYRTSWSCGSSSNGNGGLNNFPNFGGFGGNGGNGGWNNVPNFGGFGGNGGWNNFPSNPGFGSFNPPNWKFSFQNKKK